MVKIVAKALCKNSACICKAIDNYLAKSDEDLAETLAKEGFAEAEKTVQIINEIEEGIGGALKKQTKKLVHVLNSSEDWEDAREKVDNLDDCIAETVESMTAEMFQEQIPEYANIYIKDTDSELVVSTIRTSTSKWISSWSARLGELMYVETHKQMTDVIDSAISNGKSISELAKQIQAGEWRTEYYQAKRVAMTEVLRAHSVAAQEAYMQSPAVMGKMWNHAGGSLKPRQNHVDMNGIIVPKGEPFTLIGADGVTYRPMMPRDSNLPAGEAVNCQCMMQPIVSEEVLGMSYEERKAMQDAVLAEDDS